MPPQAVDSFMISNASLAGTYDDMRAQGMTLSKLTDLLYRLGVEQVFVKALAPNDNSKNQIYLGGSFDSLDHLPRGEWVVAQSSSRKPKTSGKFLLQSSIDFAWMEPSGALVPAPNSKLILYPQYPEVRFSGFLLGSQVRLGHWMNVNKQGRAAGRFLVWGVAKGQKSIGYFVTPQTKLAGELRKKLAVAGDESATGPLISLTESDAGNSKRALLSELKTIHVASPHAGMILRRGVRTPYKAPNGGGMTLEALLGIEPNGDALPDFRGWEVKGHSQNTITMLTPEPDGGVYKNDGVEKFIREYGYPDTRGRKGRLNFGGVHRADEQHARTQLTLTLIGYSRHNMGRFDPAGFLGLIDLEDKVAASWSFAKLLNHWQTKHANTAFVPFSTDKQTDKITYSYGKDVLLGEGTNFSHLLKGISGGHVYYDPGIKLEIVNRKNKIKRRSQFRVNKKGLPALYDSFSSHDLIQEPF